MAQGAEVHVLRNSTHPAPQAFERIRKMLLSRDSHSHGSWKNSRETSGWLNRILSIESRRNLRASTWTEFINWEECATKQLLYKAPECFKQFE
jgi:hypothetical protein